ncbi:MAG: amidohydrolase family protein [Deltaproteobacteria bacterium]|nr:amidohydrolase family protein [Deltaproteobacteria bacterium]
MRFAHGLLAVCTLSIGLAARAAPTVERFTLVTSAGPIGTLTVSRSTASDGERYDNQWRVDDNGRGSKLVERVELGRDGMARRWDIEGAGWFGAPVKESFAVEGNTARWSSLDDKGESPATRAFYWPNNGTPFATARLFSLLSKAPGGRLSLLPAGEVRLEKVRDVVLRSGGKPESISVYALWGLDLQPGLVIAQKGRFLGTLSPGWVFIEERLAGTFSELSALAGELSASLLEQFTKKLTTTVEGPLWLTKVRVFDPVAKKNSAPTNLVMFRGRVVGQRAEAPPKGALVIDGEGGTVLPGLVDGHGHLWDWAGPMHIAAGVTFARDPGNDNDSVLDLMRRVEAGALMGPRARLAGFLEGKSEHSAHIGFIVSSLDEAKEKLRWYADHGFWGVKIYNSMNPALVKPIAVEAKSLGLHVSGHVPAFMSSERAIDDGYQEIHHLNQLLLSFIIDAEKEDTRTPFRFTAMGERLGGLDLKRADVQRVIAKMKRLGVTHDPTMCAIAGMLLMRPGRAAPCDEGFIEHLPVTVQRMRKTAMLDVKPEQYATYERSAKKADEALLLLHRSGIPMVPGTDDTAGVALHSELEAWVQAGIPAPEVLASATLGGARLLGLESTMGSLAPGKLADLVLVDGDPTTDIRAVRRGRLVIQGERLYLPARIHEALGVKPFAKPVSLPAALVAGGAASTAAAASAAPGG